MDIPYCIGILVLDIYKPINLFKHGRKDSRESILHAFLTQPYDDV